MNTQELVSQRYAGKRATKYDRRLKSKRSEAEAAAFARLFKIAAPTSVLDCPLGTARWLDWYREISGPVVGIDLSADMLAVARAKAGTNPPGALILERGDIFAMDLSIYRAMNIELVVSTRFFNWFPLADVAVIVERLAGLKSRHMIVGVSVRPDGVSWHSRQMMRFSLWLTNARARRASKAMQHVHDEAAMIELFSRHGYRVVDKDFIFSSRSRQNFFYLLRAG